MLVRVRKPHIEMEGDVPEDVLAYFKSRFGDVEVSDDDETDEVFETDWYKGMDRRMTGADEIRVRRRIAKMTQKALAAKLGTKRPNVTAMERGKRPIGKAMADKLAAIFDVPREYFLR